MGSRQAVVSGILNSDGTLVLDEKPNLPAGRVQVVLSVVDTPPMPREDTWAVLEQIDREREALGMKARSRDEIDAEIAALRGELEAHADQVERAHEETRQLRRKTDC